MIWIISIILTISFVITGIMVGYAPSLNSIVEKDFSRKVINNATLEGFQYGELFLRAETIETTSTTPRVITDVVIEKDGNTQKEVTMSISTVNSKISCTVK